VTRISPAPDLAPPFWRFQSLGALAGVAHFVSTRAGGVSPSPYETLNLSSSSGDDPANVRENRGRIARAYGIDSTNLIGLRQVHGSTVHVVDAPPDGPLEGDALTTIRPGLMLMVLAADCAPVLIYDPERRAVGAAHAGWKGTVGQVGSKLVQTMHERFGCRPDSLIAGIGPSIGPCCYEVGADVVERLEGSFANPGRLLLPHETPSKSYLDLWRANKVQLLEAGLVPDHIEIAGLCTKCNAQSFYSDRAQRPTGRFGAGIMLLE
jgi:purine-nucleoside/S-methyl-5'-thioadenosine phosphorylase / adenosine deaminase